MKSEALSASLEDYLEAIWQIQKAKGSVLARDMAARLDVSRPSVTEALRALVRKGLVRHEPYDAVLLTESGDRLAQDVIMRHEALKKFFVQCLKVEDREAEDAACAMEHALPRAILDKLTVFVQKSRGPRKRAIQV